ncbi:MAG TPA: substrate-binding domain-containing protein [Bacteroidales bacterium]|nr:substrate-binding domain-containing protein [Bacteroidales bacterium]HRZ50338.1 substrate-binding domain-containing protein [Bacteroidales bacterium]
MKRVYGILAIALAALGIITGCRTGNRDETIRIIHAGSLSMIVKEVIDSFNAEHPGTTFLTEAWGSKDGARQITELGKPCDLFISADDRIIHTFLVPEHATWSIPFAGNEMVLAYTKKSKYADRINTNNWHEILGRDDVLTARSSPDSDPCGVRAVLLMLLSDKHYHNQDISRKLLAKDQKYIRPKEVDLIALLEKNVVDYLYIYKSIALQHNFLWLQLPDEINLGNPKLDSLYRGVSFLTAGLTPGSGHRETGAAIVYGVTIPSAAQNPTGATRFLKYFLDRDKGGAIIRKNGQNFLAGEAGADTTGVPQDLLKLTGHHAGKQ